MSWADYARHSDRLAAHLVDLGLEPGERVAVLLPDGPGVHVTFVACEKAGLVVMGIGPRAGIDEIRHLVRRAGASALLSRGTLRGADLRALFATLRDEGAPLRHHVVLEAHGRRRRDRARPPGGRRERADQRGGSAPKTSSC